MGKAHRRAVVPSHAPARQRRVDQLLREDLEQLRTIRAPAELQTNVLYYGDNLDILRKYIPDRSVDVVYLDPPFNSSRQYNVIFKNEAGRDSDAQIIAFEDTWHWGTQSDATYAYLTNSPIHGGRIPDSVSEMVNALHKVIGPTPMMAYLVEMLVRLVELHRVLKPSGSLFLHCDPTSSHYLKLALDSVFNPRHFRNEIVWKRTTAHSDVAQGALHLGRVHDTILYYTKGPRPICNSLQLPYSAEYISTHYRHTEPETGRRYRKDNLTGAKPGGDTLYEWVSPSGKRIRPYANRYWAYSKAKMMQFEAEGRLVYTKSGMPEYKRYLDEMPGQPLQDVWDDVPPLNSQAKERLGWATQKPLALLQRIIQLASRPDDVVLDPFCGCGTALLAARQLQRRWIGIDITYLAIAVMQTRFGSDPLTVVNEPTEVDGVRRLLEMPEGRYQFQWWALTKIGATPVGSVRKKGADTGIDGKITFTERNRELKTIIVSVKSGIVHRGMVGELRGTMEREGAPMGIFVTLENPTQNMRAEAKSAGVYNAELARRPYPKIQIMTAKDLLEGQKPQIPPLILPPYGSASAAQGTTGSQGILFDPDMTVG